MANYSYCAGNEALLKICQALEIDHRGIQSIRLEIDCDGMVQLYTKELVNGNQFSALTKVLKNDIRPKKIKTEIPKKIDSSVTDTTELKRVLGLFQSKNGIQ